MDKFKINDLVIYQHQDLERDLGGLCLGKTGTIVKQSIKGIYQVSFKMNFTDTVFVYIGEDYLESANERIVFNPGDLVELINLDQHPKESINVSLNENLELDTHYKIHQLSNKDYDERRWIKVLLNGYWHHPDKFKLVQPALVLSKNELREKLTQVGHQWISLPLLQ